MAKARITANGPPEIGILMYPGVQMSAALGLVDLFFYADFLVRRRLGLGTPALRTRQIAANDIEGAWPPLADRATGHGGAPVAIILPPCLMPPAPQQFSRGLIDWLRAQHDAGVILAAVCGGGFLLAETGLLHGRTATTHYDLTTLYAERFPDVMLDTDQLVIDHGDLITAGGLMAWTDLGLRFVERLLGRTAMTETARYLVLDTPGREQRFYSMFAPNLAHGDQPILKIQLWLQKMGPRNVNAGIMAKRAGLEERTFQRRFHKATGLKPTEYCQQLRVSKARELLETTTDSIDRIAWEVGYEDTGSFRKVFFRIAGLSPGDHRKRFGVRSPSRDASTLR